jgi:endonuclease/exonuclease/phosphatase family metal-dependent hydrolase
MAFFGLGFPYFLVINLMFVVYWLIRLKLTFLISTLTIFCGIQDITNFVQFHCLNTPAEEQTNVVRLLSYNVRLFDIFKWSGMKKAPEKIIDFIKKEKPDIVCFQEFVSEYNTQVPTFDTVSNLGSLQYQYFVTVKRGIYRKNHGMVTFSNYPIINKGYIHFENSSNIAIYTDLKVNSDIIRVYNIHLQSIHFEPENYLFLDSISLGYDEFNIKGIKDIGRKLKKAYIMRSRQADSIAAHIEKSDYPVIVCGDFNDTPVSYSYNTIRGDLCDAFVESGCGLEYTYSGRFSSFRIDYILHSTKIRSFGYRTTKIDYSDHYPVQCEILIK